MARRVRTSGGPLNVDAVKLLEVRAQFVWVRRKRPAERYQFFASAAAVTMSKASFATSATFATSGPPR